MKSTVLFLLCAAAIAASAVCAYLGHMVWCGVGAAVALLLLLAIWRSIALQLRTIATGMDLLRSRDFASRLRHVGEPQADSMVDLYNSLMENLKTERLRASEQHGFLSKLIEASPMGVAICTFDGDVEQQNESFRRLATPAVMKALQGLADGEDTTVREGTQVVRCSRNFFMDRGFRRPFYLVERLTDEIVRAETDVFNKLVRTVSHEVNNTLGGVISTLDTLADIHGDDADIKPVISGCSDSCRQLGDFVKSYAEVAKLPELKLEDVDLTDFAGENLPFLRSMCPPGIEIEMVSDGGEACVQADPMLLQRVVINIVKNSIESIGRRGKIELNIKGRTLRVIDTGKGIRPEDIKNIFRPFYSTKHPDRGLGLMLVSEILRRHNADFSLATMGPFTYFTIKFKN
ncbi:MAG: HAMP domain-containing histidine kinase [Muribaculaceae bacterium]|nr:HAMP domain-containing histidine kinase [Muribaculaceae bacterium]